MNQFVYPKVFLIFLFRQLCSVLWHRSLISNIISLDCLLCNLNPPSGNKLMESGFNFLISFYTFSPSHQTIFINITSYFFNNLSTLLLTFVKMNIQSSFEFERWLHKSKHQPSKTIDFSFIIISSFNPMKYKTISLALLNASLQKAFLSVST